ncbi:FtsX-like permease family protein [bacterium]|nr:FtsX-like permease family protein [bacterium]
MLRSYFISAFRHLVGRPGTTAVNVLSLSLGLACTLVLYLFLHQEWTFDTMHANADRIYRAVHVEKPPGRDRFKTASTPFDLATAIEENVPDVQAAVRMFTMEMPMEKDDGSTLREVLLYSDRGLFELFEFEVLEGDGPSTLADPGKMVISRSAGVRLFGEGSPLGKRLTLHQEGLHLPLTVGAVVEDIPQNSSVRFDIAVNLQVAMPMFQEQMLRSWGSIMFKSYLMLKPDASAEVVSSKVNAVCKPYYDRFLDQSETSVYMQPIREIHLDSTIRGGMSPVSNPLYSLILAAIAGVVLLIGVLNFVTLSLASSIERAREVGVRKVLGADRNRVRLQFFGEALILSFSAMMVGVVVAELMLPMLNRFANQTGLDLVLQLDGNTVAVLLLLPALVGLAAGAYPALILSRFQPIQTLKSRVDVSKRSKLLPSLVIVQFTLATALVISVLIVGRQVRYMRDKPLGMDVNRVLVLHNMVERDESFALFERFRERAETIPGVEAVTAGSNSFRTNWSFFGYTDDQGIYRRFRFGKVHEKYPGFMHLELVAGRLWDQERSVDRETAYLVNETFVEAFGLDQPIGAKLPGDEFGEHEIVGVLRDFHYRSLHETIEPLLLAQSHVNLVPGISDVDVWEDPFAFNYTYVRIAPENITQTLEQLERIWSDVAKGIPFHPVFQDEEIAQRYRQEEGVERVVSTAAIFSITLAVLGLLSLASLTVARRTKEIGIRKVLGATTWGIASILVMSYIRLVLLATLIATPVAWWAMRTWLQGFAYRIEPEPWPFVLAALGAIAMTVGAVGLRALAAARANPVKTLRYE